MIATAALRAPYPWFGGKASIMQTVWAHFGDVRNFVDPFLGSAAALLQRPQPFAGTETVNDIDGMVSNFWRAIAADPEAVAQSADWPVSEVDLHARHLWLVNEGRQHVERLKEDADYFDARIAGWWVWGCCQWIGSGWCEHPEWKQLPHLGNAGMGIHRPSQKRPHLGNAGMGIHRPSQQLPHLGNAGMGEATPLPERGQGHPPTESEAPLIAPCSDLYDYFRLLSERFRRVRVCCGGWSRVCGPTPTVKQGRTAVFLDPPYSRAERDDNLYACESDVAADVRRWCLENGGDKRLRIALCGYAGEGHEELETSGWSVLPWKARGGYGSQGNNQARNNAGRECIWFSPHCLRPDSVRTLFSEESP